MRSNENERAGCCGSRVAEFPVGRDARAARASARTMLLGAGDAEARRHMMNRISAGARGAGTCQR